jgi:hypothetical protein
MAYHVGARVPLGYTRRPHHDRSRRRATHVVRREMRVLAAGGDGDGEITVGLMKGAAIRGWRLHHRASAAPCTYLVFLIHASIGPVTVLSGVSKEKTSDM